jgi:hypothetical protein
VAALAALAPRVVAGGHGVPMTGAGTAAAVRVFARRFSGLPHLDRVAER